MKYLFSKCTLCDDGTAVIPQWAVDRWTRQMNTEYDQLPEEEKESDREEAQRYMDWMKKSCMGPQGIREGDILTGLEILAGMSREEQQKWLDWGCPSDLGIGTTKTDNDYCFKFREVISDMGDRRENCEKCKLHTLSQQYIYRNGTFEVYEGEK